MRARTVGAITAACLLSCSYDFENPADALRAGEVSGRVMADRGAGVAPFGGVSVTLRNSTLSQVSRDTGRFLLVPLPAGRHRLLLRKGTAWALERDLEVAYGRDGQPEGVVLGDVVLRRTVDVRGAVGRPAAASGDLSGVVVDEASGMTTELSADGTFRFPVLSAGPHRLKVAVRDAAGGQWVGGPVDLDLAGGPDVVTLPELAVHPASGEGRVTLSVAAVGADAGFDPRTVTITGLPGAAPDSSGLVDVTVPEGSYAFTVTPAGAPAASGLATILAADLQPGTRVDAVALAGEVAEVGPVYLVTPRAEADAALGCLTDADCACLDAGCGAPGVCRDRLCAAWTPPAQAPASTPFCSAVDLAGAPCAAAGACGQGAGGAFCAFPGASGFCAPCGSSCTLDGDAAAAPSAIECVALRTVSGTWRTTYWHEDGTRTDVNELVDPADAIAAIAGDDPRTAVRIPGTLLPDGTFAIANVPVGRYVLEFAKASSGSILYVDETASDLDLGMDRLGRPDLVYATLSTPVSFQLTGLSPFNSGADQLFFHMPGAGGPIGPAYPPFASGATSGTYAPDWLALVQWGIGLLDAGRGDGVWLHQNSARQTTIGGTTYRYVAASGYAHVTGLTLTDGTPVSIPTAMTTGPTSSVVADFRASQFAAYDGEVTAASAPSRVTRMAVWNAPHTLARPAPFNGGAMPPQDWSFYLELPQAASAVDVNLGAIPYVPLPGWPAFRLAQRYATVGFLAPGAASGAGVSAGIARFEVMPAAGPGVPALSPPRALAVNGLDARVGRTALATPLTVSWTAPSLGVPAMYVISVHRISGPAGGATTATQVVGVRTAATSWTFPAGALAAGESYVFVVTGYGVPSSAPGMGWDVAPRRRGLPLAWASTMSGLLQLSP